MDSQSPSEENVYPFRDVTRVTVVGMQGVMGMIRDQLHEKVSPVLFPMEEK